MTLVLLCLAAFAAGFVDAAVGGGGLIQVPALLLLAPDLPIPTLFGTSKLAGFSGTAIATRQYAKSVTLPWRTVLPAAVASFAFSLLGARAVASLHPEVLRPLIFGMLIVVAIYTAVRPDFGGRHEPRFVASHERMAGVVLGAAFGFYDGFFGPGVGSFGIVAFVTIFGFDFLAATAATKVLNVGSNLSALGYFAATGHIRYDLALPMAACQVAGATLGTRLAVRRGVAVLRPLFLAVMVALIARLGWDLWRR